MTKKTKTEKTKKTTRCKWCGKRTNKLLLGSYCSELCKREDVWSIKKRYPDELLDKLVKKIQES
jgi:hypothetical protein